MLKITAKVEGLKCPNCERHVNEAIKEAFSIKKVTASHTDKEIVMEGLDGIISDALQDKIWDMIYNRWCYYEDFCNKK